MSLSEAAEHGMSRVGWQIEIHLVLDLNLSVFVMGTYQAIPIPTHPCANL